MADFIFPYKTFVYLRLVNFQSFKKARDLFRPYEIRKDFEDFTFEGMNRPERKSEKKTGNFCQIRHFAQFATICTT